MERNLLQNTQVYTRLLTLFFNHCILSSKMVIKGKTAMGEEGGGWWGEGGQPDSVLLQLCTALNYEEIHHGENRIYNTLFYSLHPDYRGRHIPNCNSERSQY